MNKPYNANTFIGAPLLDGNTTKTVLLNSKQ